LQPRLTTLSDTIAGGKMNHDTALTLSIINLIIASLFLFILLAIAASVDTPRIKNEDLTIESKLEFQINQIAKNITGLEQLLKSIVGLTQKHESILSGAQSKGTLGEQHIEDRLTDLPHEWYDRNVPFPGGTVEFALRTPDKRWIPIDSQWTATELLFKLEKANSQSQRNLLRAEAHQAVSVRAKNALRFLDKENTLGFCIVAVPDPIFNLCVDIQAELASYSIVLVSYSLLVPYILLIVNQYLKTTRSTESLEYSQLLSRSAAEIELIQKYITTDVVLPLEIVGRQQTQHIRQNQGLEQVYANLNQIQSQLNALKSMINPVPNSDIASIPPTLQHRLNHVRNGLLEGVAKHNGQSKKG